MKPPRLLSIILLLCGSVYTSSASAIQRVYLMAGQSNMSGTASTHFLPPAYRHTPRNVTFFHKGQQRPLGRYGYFGPEVSFAHQLSRRYPEDEHIIIKYAAGGSHIQQWMPGNPYYQNMLREIRFSLQWHTPKIDAIFWMQGESDAMSTFRATHYDRHLNQLIHNLRHDLKSPSSLFVIGQVNPKSNGHPMVDLVQKKQQQVSAHAWNTQLVSSYGLGKSNDNVHYNAQGQIELGKRFANAYTSWESSLIARRLHSELMALFQ